jgi:hypothetical protein
MLLRAIDHVYSVRDLGIEYIEIGSLPLGVGSLTIIR